MLTVYILRHGETDWNALGKLQGREDIELNSKGIEQAQNTAYFFKSFTIDSVYSSPLKRAKKTAEIIAKTLHIKAVSIIEDLTERNWGEASGLMPEERKAKYPEGVVPGQEEFEDMLTRGENALKILENISENKTIVVVSHGAIINSILYYISKGEFGSFKTRLGNATINKLVFINNTWSVEFYNKSILELTVKELV